MSEEANEAKRVGRVPWWVCVVIGGLSLIEPVLHVALPRMAPAGLAHTGLHTVDTYAYVTAMRYFGDGYYSPYAGCTSPCGERDPSLYALPHHHVYGWIGMVARALGIPLFAGLGIANGLALALMLGAAYALLRAISPRNAGAAFLIFALGGGLGGVAYVIAWAVGWTNAGVFGRDFLRFFVYELNEGVRFQPYLLADRLYYTLPLALGLLGLRALIRVEAGRGAELAAAVLVGLSSFLNLRVGPMFWGVGMIWLVCSGPIVSGARVRLVAGGLWTGAMVLGTFAALRMLQQNPELGESVFRSLSGAMWLIPFLYSIVPVLPLVLIGLIGPLRGMRGFARYAGFAGAGYAVAYTALYLGYQFVWHRNWLRGGDTSAAIVVSDPALLGVTVGLGAAWLTSRSVRREMPADAVRAAESSALAWAALWFLCFFGLSVSAIGRGWFLQYMPQRCMVMLGLPLAVLAAAGWRRIHERRPRLAAGLLAVVVLCGLCSIFVTWGIVYGPLLRGPSQRHFPWTDYAYAPADKLGLLDTVQEGVVLAPSMGDPLYGDIAVQHPGVKTVYGNGTMDYSRHVMPEVRAEVAAFFTPGADPAARAALVKAWCVDYVFCPGPDALSGELAQLPWLEAVGRAGDAALFRVLRPDQGRERAN